MHPKPPAVILPPQSVRQLSSLQSHAARHERRPEQPDDTADTSDAQLEFTQS
jgi:hypothetical protein